MIPLVIGMSHRSAPLEVLERAAVTRAQLAELGDRLVADPHIGEVVVVATCNRLEVYAAAATFHGAVTAIGDALCAVTSLSSDELTSNLYVHYDDRAIAHVLRVACGLDSMAVGEAQILGQLRTALQTGQERGWVGEDLNHLVQHALRVGKQAHTDTDIDMVSVSLVEAGLQVATDATVPLDEATVAVIGTGAMSGLATATAARLGAGSLVVVGRDDERTQRLADRYGAQPAGWEHLAQTVAGADIVVSATAAKGYVIERAVVESVTTGRPARARALVDLALPRDVDPDVATLPGTTVIDLDDLGRRLHALAISPAVAQAEELVTVAVADHLASRAERRVSPTVAALRSRAADLVAMELARLDTRLPDLDERARAELKRTVHRVVEKLLHTPTVRVKQLAAEPNSGDYAHALQELFDLDPVAIAAVSAPPSGGPQ